MENTENFDIIVYIYSMEADFPQVVQTAAIISPAQYAQGRPKDKLKKNIMAAH